MASWPMSARPVFLAARRAGILGGAERHSRGHFSSTNRDQLQGRPLPTPVGGEWP